MYKIYLIPNKEYHLLLHLIKIKSMHHFVKSGVLSAFLLAILFVSCDYVPEDEKKEKDFQQNLNSFTTTIDKVDSTLDLMDEMQNDIDRIEADRAAGRITDAEAIAELNKINNTLGRQIARKTNNKNVIGLPNWAKRLGLTEPVGLAFDSDFSQSTSENNPGEGFNSVILVYRGDYKYSMKQAEQIAQKAGIPLSQDYKDAIKLKEEYGIETILGASYMNFKIGADDNPKYNISITVDNDGTLTINATDTEALLNQLDQ